MTTYQNYLSFNLDAGHYHKDAGKEGPDQEYRFVEALRLYSNATRVASKYIYERGDSMQLVKVVTGIAQIILMDILCENGNRKQSRKWFHHENAVAVGSWLLAFYDSLLLWEERQNRGTGRMFVEILSPSHECSIGNMMQLFSIQIRLELISRIFDNDTTNLSKKTHSEVESPTQASSNSSVFFFKNPLSRRMRKESPLVHALKKPKVSVREIELTIPLAYEFDMTIAGGENRRTKRARRRK